MLDQVGMDHIFHVTTARVDTLEFQVRGDKYNPRWFAAEGIGWDFATLIVGIPVLLVSALLFVRGSMRGGIVLAGMLAYVAYQYLMYVTGWAYNNLFLLYVALYSLPIVGMVLTVQEMGIDALARRVAVRGQAGSGRDVFFTRHCFYDVAGQDRPAMLQGGPEMLTLCTAHRAP